LFLGGFANQLNAEPSDPNTLFYTYIGPTIGMGFNMASYKYWDRNSDTLESTSFSGAYVDFGCYGAVFVDRFIADIRIVYSMNFNDGTHKVFHPSLTMTGKYVWDINDSISWALGMGLYLETPPATSKHYGSSGFVFPVSLYMNVFQDSKLFLGLVPYIFL